MSFRPKEKVGMMQEPFCSANLVRPRRLLKKRTHSVIIIITGQADRQTGRQAGNNVNAH